MVIKGCNGNVDSNAKWVATRDISSKYKEGFVFDEYNAYDVEKCGSPAPHTQWIALCNRCLVERGLIW